MAGGATVAAASLLKLKKGFLLEAPGTEGETVDCALSVGTGPKCLRNGLLLGLSVLAAGTGELSGVGVVDTCKVDGRGGAGDGGCGAGEAGLDCVEGARTNSSTVLS